MPTCKARCCASSSPRWNAVSARTVPNAVRSIHRFGSSLNEQVHFRCCAIGGVFAPAAETETDDVAAGLDEDAIAAVQAQVQRRVLRTFVRCGLIEKDDADAMAGWEHSGEFSVDTAVRIAGADRAGLERLLRYCVRPPFALEHLQQQEPSICIAAPNRALEPLAIWC